MDEPIQDHLCTRWESASGSLIQPSEVAINHVVEMEPACLGIANRVGSHIMGR